MATTKKTSSKTKVPAEGKVSPRSMHDGDKPGPIPGQEPEVIVFGKDDPKPVLPEPKDPVIERLDRIIALLEGTLTVDKKGLSLSGKFWDRFLDPDM